MSDEERKRGPRGRINIDAATLRRIQERSGLTVPDLEEVSGVGEATIIRARRIGKAQVSIGSAIRISRALGVSLDEIELKERIAVQADADDVASEDEASAKVTAEPTKGSDGKDGSYKEADAPQAASPFYARHTTQNVIDNFLPTYGPSLKERFIDLWEFTELFIGAYESSYPHPISLSPSILYFVTSVSHSDFDVLRVKGASIEQNRFTAAAILALEIVKQKPLWINADQLSEDFTGSYNNSDPVLLNITYAANVAIAYSKLNIRDITDDIFSEFIHVLLFGNNDWRSIALVLSLMNKCSLA